MNRIITLTLLHINHAKQIAIGFENDNTIKQDILSFGQVHWCHINKTYFTSYNNEALHLLFSYLQSKGYYVDYSAITNPKRPKQIQYKNPIKPPGKMVMYRELPKKLKTLLRDYINYLRGKRLSEQTISTYGYFTLRFMFFNRTIGVSLWKNKQLDLFMSEVMAKEQYSISSHRQCISALKYLTAFCDLEDFDATSFKRPKRNKQLPVVLSKEAIITLLQVTKNLKHRVILGLMYSCGLRIGELLALQTNDLDFSRSQVFIKKGKGRKDRVVVMAEVMKPLLLNYYNTYTPKHYFIEGRDGGKYSASSVRQFLKHSCKLAKIHKHITPHTLRHSYATHMLENGVGLRHIQELLGHSKPETTMIYTHVARKDLIRISNPLDTTIQDLTNTFKNDKKVSISGKNFF